MTLDHCWLADLRDAAYHWANQSMCAGVNMRQEFNASIIAAFEFVDH